jgi:hypothetical protein
MSRAVAAWAGVLGQIIGPSFQREPARPVALLAPEQFERSADGPHTNYSQVGCIEREAALSTS